MKHAELWRERNPPKTTKKPEPRWRAGLRRLVEFPDLLVFFPRGNAPIMGGSEFYLWAGMTPFVPLCQQH